MLRTAGLLDSFLSRCQGASPAVFRRLRYLGAAQLPGRWVATGTGLSPASLPWLIWTHSFPNEPTPREESVHVRESSRTRRVRRVAGGDDSRAALFTRWAAPR